MRVYQFVAPRDRRFAWASRRGTWSRDHIPRVCPECGASRKRRVSPLVLEWLPGSGLVPDFCWPGFNDEVVVSQRVRELLNGEIGGTRFLPIQMWQNPRLGLLKRPRARLMPRVWLPYEGPPLWDLQTDAWCDLDLDHAGVLLAHRCSICGTDHYTALTNDRLLVDPSTWRGEALFRLRQYPTLLYCTEQAKSLLEARGFTNAGFHLAGEIPE